MNPPWLRATSNLQNAGASWTSGDPVSYCNFTKKGPREVFYHNPLILNTAIRAPLKFLSFHFELAWLKQPEFLPTVKWIWDEPTKDKDALSLFISSKSLRNTSKDRILISQGRIRREKKKFMKE